MSHGSAEDVLSLDELTEVLAEATDTTPEELEQAAAAIENPPPEEATVIDD